VADEGKEGQNAGAFDRRSQLPLVFGANTGLGAAQNFAPVGNKTPQRQDVFVVRVLALFAKTAKLRYSFVVSPSTTAFTLFSHNGKSLKHENKKT